MPARKFAGCTVHQRDGQLDVGPILDQAGGSRVARRHARNPGRARAHEEHIIYPRAVAALLQQR